MRSRSQVEGERLVGQSPGSAAGGGAAGEEVGLLLARAQGRPILRGSPSERPLGSAAAPNSEGCGKVNLTELS